MTATLIPTITEHGLTVTSASGSVRLQADWRKMDLYVDADEGYSSTEMDAVLTAADQLGLTMFDDDEDAPDLTETGVRGYFRLSDDVLAAA